MTPPDGWLPALAHELGLELWRIPVVILSAAGIYAVLAVVVKVFGVRVLSGWSGRDVVAALMVGAVCGRVILGHTPTLAAGAIGLLTLVVLEILVGALAAGLHLPPGLRPRVVVAHGRILDSALRRTHLTRAEVLTALRRAGVADLAQVQAAVLEPTGQLSVVRQGAPMTAEMLRDVIDAQEVLGQTAGAPSSSGGRSPKW